MMYAFTWRSTLQRGSHVCLRTNAAPALAGVPATVIDIWPRFRSGDRLITLEYAPPVQLGDQVIRQLEVFASEVEPASAAPRLAQPAQPPGAAGE